MVFFPMEENLKTPLRYEVKLNNNLAMENYWIPVRLFSHIPLCTISSVNV